MIATGSLPIVTYPNHVLSRRSDEVMEIDDDIVSLIEAMKLSMQAAKGIGLAAPQVGRNLRIVTIGCVPGPALGLINPVIVKGHGRTSIVEGCLSFPGFECRPRGRRKQVHVRAYNVRGEPVELEPMGCCRSASSTRSTTSTASRSSIVCRRSSALPLVGN